MKNKTGDEIPDWCEVCNKQGYVFLPDSAKSYSVICSVCKTSSHYVWCEKCGMGGPLIEHYQPSLREWVCKKCATRYDVLFDGNNVVERYFEKRHRNRPRRENRKGSLLKRICAMTAICVLLSIAGLVGASFFMKDPLDRFEISGACIVLENYPGYDDYAFFLLGCLLAAVSVWSLIFFIKHDFKDAGKMSTGKRNARGVISNMSAFSMLMLCMSAGIIFLASSEYATVKFDFGSRMMTSRSGFFTDRAAFNEKCSIRADYGEYSSKGNRFIQMKVVLNSVNVFSYSTGIKNRNDVIDKCNRLNAAFNAFTRKPR